MKPSELSPVDLVRWQVSHPFVDPAARPSDKRAGEAAMARLRAAVIGCYVVHGEAARVKA
jgi:hypothetical protein